jgi:hypothetical protein
MTPCVFTNALTVKLATNGLVLSIVATGMDPNEIPHGRNATSMLYDNMECLSAENIVSSSDSGVMDILFIDEAEIEKPLLRF